MDQRNKPRGNNNGNEQQNSDADVQAVMGISGVQGNWQGPPAFTPADVLRLAEEAKVRNAQQ